MVSKASEDLPEPDRPVITISRSRGRSRSMFLRLCVRAPRMRMVSMRGVARGKVNYTKPGRLLIACGGGLSRVWSGIDQVAGGWLQSPVRPARKAVTEPKRITTEGIIP